MNLMHTVLSATAVIVAACMTGCAPPETENYDDLDTDEVLADAPKIVSFSPREGDENVNRRPIIRVTFDRQLDADTIERSAFKLYSGPLSKWMIFYYDPTEKQLITWPGGYLLRQSTWVFALRNGITGANGVPAAEETVTYFRTGDDIIAETPYTIRAKDEVLSIFETRCASCHGGSNALAGLKLDTQANIVSTAISRPSKERTSRDLVVPTQPGLSYLLYKLLDDDETISGLPMPRSLYDEETTELLSKEEKQTLVDWIAAGAVFFDDEDSDE